MSRVMSRRAIASVLGTLMVATAVSQVPASATQTHHPPLPKPIKHSAKWTLKFSGAAGTNVPFALYSQREKDHLYYAWRKWGISLKWTESAKNEWKFVKCGSSGTSSPVRYDQKLALYNTSDKEYMVYGKRNVGINLSWSKRLDQKACQWKVRGGKTGKAIGPSPVKDALLFNTAVKDYLVNEWRPAGVSLRWYTYGIGDQIWDNVKKATCFAGVLSNEAKVACTAFKALREFEKAMGYSRTVPNPLSQV
ncbi:hypothetical protein ACFWWT_26735 [Streptomyces sp. NPDC058676]|uniref:hypothetical protein n=1 Tax=unclassified Streptomyces TaxID=2593676 RepID=UPI003653CCC6